MTVRIQREDFDVGAEIAAMSKGRAEVGAVATFTGLRDASAGARFFTEVGGLCLRVMFEGWR